MVSTIRFGTRTDEPSTHIAFARRRIGAIDHCPLGSDMEIYQTTLPIQRMRIRGAFM